MLQFVWFRQFAIVIIVVLGIATVLHARVVEDTADAVRNSMRFDVSWIGAHGRIEAAQLEAYLARYAALGRQADADNTKLYYQILLGRLDSWSVGGYGEFLTSNPESGRAYDELMRLLESVDAEMSNLDSTATASQLLDTLAPVGATIEKIGAEATDSAVNKAAAIRQTLTEKQATQHYLVVTALASAAIMLIVSAFQNRTLRRAHRQVGRAADKFAYLAHHDPLTGLANRTAFPDTNQPTDADASHTAVIVFDLDGFKLINDTWGHMFGDKLLIAAARRLEEIISTVPGNVVARLGGDEFAALLHLRDKAEAQTIADRALEALKRPFEIDGSSVTISATAGIAISTRQNQNARGLLEDADLAQSEAKARKKGSVSVYDQSLREMVERRLTLENDLRDAIGNGEITPHYQIQVDLGTGAVVGVEALARWHHAQLGPIPPDEFIPIAEASGQIVDIGKHMIACACRDALRLPPDVQVAVNLSVIQIMQGEIMETTADALMATRLPPERLKLEVTESVMMADPKQPIAVLSELRYLGVSLALDDFGTGYSSLSYLTTFHWDEIKIDRAFVNDLDTDSIGLSVIEAVLVLAKKTGAKVVVEGVETHKQLELLQGTGCDIGQGYFFGKPVPIDMACAQIREINKSLPGQPLPARRKDKRRQCPE
ncbi:MAG: bifunctional diguanylate cyclase/phosphodiesterase [Devosia marina]|uniref:putative bifunctional diguanylate cyclase/phosphodiesterase n=1 Tax=Devosia marina TaxID=2683198 RepID=UPI000D5C5A9B